MATHTTPDFPPGQGFRYSDTGYTVIGILVEEITGRPLHAVYCEIVFDPLTMERTWVEGHEPALVPEVAHHYHGELDMTTVSPTIDWAGGGLVTTTADLAGFVRGLWSGRILDPGGLDEMTRWTPGASFRPATRCATTTTGWGWDASSSRAWSSSAIPGSSGPLPSMRRTTTRF